MKEKNPNNTFDKTYYTFKHQGGYRIIVMDDGKITDVGTHDELLKTSEIYREVYDSQQKGGDADAS